MPITPCIVKIPTVMQTESVSQADINCDQNTVCYSFYSEKYLHDNNMDEPPPEWENNGGTRNIMVAGDTVLISQIISWFESIYPVVQVEYVA
jgi:hypothetical protein